MLGHFSRATMSSEVAVLFTPFLMGKSPSRVTALEDAFLWGRCPGDWTKLCTPVPCSLSLCLTDLHDLFFASLMESASVLSKPLSLALDFVSAICSHQALPGTYFSLPFCHSNFSLYAVARPVIVIVAVL